MKSKFLELDSRDLLKGLVMVVLVAVLTTSYEALMQGGFNIDYQKIALAGVIAGVGYLIKNLGTDQNDRMLGESKK